jgi:hypothetical protein
VREAKAKIKGLLKRKRMKKKRSTSLSRQNSYSYGVRGSSISNFGLCLEKLENRNENEISSF